MKNVIKNTITLVKGVVVFAAVMAAILQAQIMRGIPTCNPFTGEVISSVLELFF